MTTKKKNMVLVTTNKRGVFYGQLVSKTRTGETTWSTKLRNVQMCVYWSRDVNGVFGLAVDGPSRSCRISKPAPEMLLEGVECISTVTPAAERAFEARPWG